MLNTKLNRPSLSKDLLYRSHLARKLEENSHLPLILISAPAGYGKSVLVSQWLKQHQKDFSWLSLDEGMNDQFTFISYLIEIIERTGSFKIQKFQEDLQDLHLLSWDVIIKIIINSVNDLQKQLRLILDDYYLIKKQEIHQLVKSLISENLANLQVVIITRWDPPFQLSELRLYQKMLELRIRDLRFHESEIYQILSSSDSIKLSDSEIRLLLANTEGWILAIRMHLFAQSLNKFGDSDSEKEILPNDLDRLMIHISENLDRKFFRQMQLCALLDEFDIELISQICTLAFPDSCAAEDFLSKLIELNFFLVPIRGESGKFRFHHLIKDILKRQLKNSEPPIIGPIYNRVSNWFADKGQIDEAISYSVKGEDYEFASHLILKNRNIALEKGQWWIVKSWLEKLPDHIHKSNPGLLLAEVRVYEDTWKLEEMYSILETLKLLDIDNTDQETQSEYFFHLGHLSLFLNSDAEKAEYYFEQSKLINPKTDFFGARRELLLAIARQMLHKSRIAFDALDQIEKLFSPTHIMNMRSLNAKVFIHLLSSEIADATNVSRRFQFAAGNCDFESIKALSLYLQGNISFQTIDDRNVYKALNQAVTFKGTFNYRIYFDSMAGLILCSSLKGDKKTTESLLNEMKKEVFELKDSKFQLFYQSVKARVVWHSNQGDQELDWALNDWVKQPIAMYFFMLDVPSMTKLRILISHGAILLVKEAFEVLSKLDTSLKEINNSYHTIDIELLKAIAEFRLGNKALAEKSLENAVLLADSTEMTRPILEVYQVMPALFNLIKSSNESFHIFARLGLSKSSTKFNPEKLSLEDLTIREQEIANLIGKGLRNKEIADRLHISTVTVKSHLTNIYRKLDVSNRTSMLKTIRG